MIRKEYRYVCIYKDMYKVIIRIRYMYTYTSSTSSNVIGLLALLLNFFSNILYACSHVKTFPDNCFKICT